MDNDKKMIIDGASINGGNDVEKTSDQMNSAENVVKQRPMKKKRRLIIVSSILFAILICILVTAIVLFSLWTTRVQFQETKHRTIRDKEVDEELYQDTVDSLTFYHVRDNTMEIWVILDYNRELEIMRVNKGESSTCYVSPRDTSKTRETNQTNTEPLQMTTRGADVQRNETLPVVSLRPSSRPIREKSILGKRGQALCQDFDTFWILSSCDPSAGGDVPASRVRRALWLIYSCYWDWTRCHYIYFANSPNSRYYGCDWTCGNRYFEY